MAGEQRAPKRYTFVGYLPCGHVNYLAADPVNMIYQFPKMTPDERMEEWQSLVDNLAHYIKRGRVEILNEEEMKDVELILCNCKQPRTK